MFLVLDLYQAFHTKSLSDITLTPRQWASGTNGNGRGSMNAVTRENIEKNGINRCGSGCENIVWEAGAVSSMASKETIQKGGNVNFVININFLGITITMITTWRKAFGYVLDVIVLWNPMSKDTFVTYPNI